MGLGLRHQGGRGTCSVFASTFLLEYLISEERGLFGLDLSEEYLNSAANRATGRTDDGDFFSSIASGYADYGIVDETWMPYQADYAANRQADAELVAIGQMARFFTADFMYSTAASKMGLDDRQIEAVVNQLDNNVPVAFGFHGAKQATTVTVGARVICDDLRDPDDEPYAHSVAIVGYRCTSALECGGYFTYRNSYGPNWGDAGHGYFTFNYAKKFIYDAVMYGRDPEFLPALHAVRVPLEVQQILPSPPLHRMDELGRQIHPASRIG
jgi:C1A family cysteine protease